MAADALSTHNHVIFCALVVAVTAGQRSTTGSLIAPMHSGRTSPRAALSSSSGHRRERETVMFLLTLPSLLKHLLEGEGNAAETVSPTIY